MNIAELRKTLHDIIYPHAEQRMNRAVLGKACNFAVFKS